MTSDKKELKVVLSLWDFKVQLHSKGSAYKTKPQKIGPLCIKMVPFSFWLFKGKVKKRKIIRLGYFLPFGPFFKTLRLLFAIWATF